MPKNSLDSGKPVTNLSFQFNMKIVEFKFVNQSRNAGTFKNFYAN